MKTWPRRGPLARENRKRHEAAVRAGFVAGRNLVEIARQLGISRSHASSLASEIGLVLHRGRPAAEGVTGHRQSVSAARRAALGPARFVRVCPAHLLPVHSTAPARHEEAVMCQAGHRVWRWAVYDQERDEIIAGGSAKHSVVAFDVEWADWPDQAA